MNFSSLCSRLSVLALGLAGVLPARAQLLNAAYEARLVSWINHGPLVFTPDFAKTAGDGQNAFAFHAAADGKGPNLSLFDVTPFDSTDGRYDLPDQVIAGGIPASWNSSNSWNIVLDPLDQSAMLFNLTKDFAQHENISTVSGAFQSLNSPFFGPTFGQGDLVTDFDLEHGFAFHNSYGGTSSFAPNILGDVGHADLFRINRLEVYSLSLVSIPEPATYGLIMAAGLAAAVALRHRNRPLAVRRA